MNSEDLLLSSCKITIGELISEIFSWEYRLEDINHKFKENDAKHVIERHRSIWWDKEIRDIKGRIAELLGKMSPDAKAEIFKHYFGLRKQHKSEYADKYTKHALSALAKGLVIDEEGKLRKEGEIRANLAIVLSKYQYLYGENLEDKCEKLGINFSVAPEYTCNEPKVELSRSRM
ncbi:hypothetical protein IT418_03990 [bacterium]|nr:hypothetical protein [bacterium]